MPGKLHPSTVCKIERNHANICCVLQIGCVLFAGLAGKGDFNELMAYSGQAGYKPDYLYLMQRLMMDNPEAAVNLAKMIAKQPGPPMDLNTLADLFLQRNAVREATAFLLDVLQENKPEHDKLQTKVTHLWWQLCLCSKSSSA